MSPKYLGMPVLKVRLDAGREFFGTDFVNFLNPTVSIYLAYTYTKYFSRILILNMLMCMDIQQKIFMSQNN